MWEKENLLVTSNFFCSYSVCYPYLRTLHHFHQILNYRLQFLSVSKSLRLVIWNCFILSSTNVKIVLCYSPTVMVLFKPPDTTLFQGTKHQTVVKLTVVPCPPVVEVLIKRPDVKYQLGFSVQNGVVSIHIYLLLLRVLFQRFITLILVLPWIYFVPYHLFLSIKPHI